MVSSNAVQAGKARAMWADSRAIPSGRIRLLRRMIIVGICLAQVAVIRHLHPVNFFGWYGDDAIYFSSAKALADGNDYVLPFLPGTPPASKYPVLYPWLLSLVWRLDPSFPGNLALACAANVGFDLAFVLLSYPFLRRVTGISESGALMITALCAFQPNVLLCTMKLLTDIPFAALAVAAMFLATRSIEKKSNPAVAMLNGVVSGLAILMRVLGLPIAAGLLIFHAIRAGWKKSAAFAIGMLPFSVATVLRMLYSHPAQLAAASGSPACAKSWQITWLYFTSYLGFWKESAIEHHMLWQYVTTNLSLLGYQIGAYFVDLRQVRVIPVVMILFTLVLLLTVRGLIRQVQDGGWQPVHFALGFYLPVLLLWDWTSFDRFLIPFLPLIFSGAWTEGARVLKAARANLARQRNASTWLGVALCLLAGGALLGLTGASWWRVRLLLADISANRSELLPEKKQAFAWLQQHSSPDARLISYEPALAYLYSDRQAITPAILLPTDTYDTQFANLQISCLLAPAGPVGASYWLSADDDFRFESKEETVLEKQTTKQLEASHTLLFRSQNGHVRIYRLP